MVSVNGVLMVLKRSIVLLLCDIFSAACYVKFVFMAAFGNEF